MIVQLFASNLGIKNVFNIPFQGIFDVKFVRVDVRVNNTVAYQLIFITSDRLPFNVVPYEPYSPIPPNRRLQSVKGLFLDTRNLSVSLSQNTAIENHQKTYEYKNVFLDGRIDFSFFSSGIGSHGVASMPFGLSPPFAISQILLTLDITPVKEIIPHAPSSNVYQIVAPINANTTAVSGYTLTPYYGNVKLTVLRIDSLMNSSVFSLSNITYALYKVQSDNLMLTPGNNSFIFLSNDNYSTAYYSDNVVFNLKTDGTISFTFSRQDNAFFGAFGIGFMMTFTLDYDN